MRTSKHAFYPSVFPLANTKGVKGISLLCALIFLIYFMPPYSKW